MAQQKTIWHQKVNHQHAAIALVATMFVVGIALHASITRAAGDRYNFIARGVVTEINGTTSINVDVTHITGKGVDDLRGVNREFKLVSSTKLYRNTGGKDHRVTTKTLAVGQEIGFKGVAKDDDSYAITWLRIHDRSFTVVGTIKEVDRTAKQYKVSVTTSTYRPGTYNGKDVVINYGGNTDFQTNSGASREADEVKAESQKAKIIGTIGDHSRWEMTKLIDGYTGK